MSIHSKRCIAVITGSALILMAIVAVFPVPLISGIFVPGNPAATALNLSTDFNKFTGSAIAWLVILFLDLLVSVGVYAYYKKEKAKIAFISASLRLLYSIFLGAAIYRLLKVTTSVPPTAIYVHIRAFYAIWGWGLIVFGLHLMVLGILFKNESGKKWPAIIIKALLILAGAGYLVLYAGMLIVPDPLAFKAIVEPVFLVPMILGEIFFALWMLVKGGKAKKL